MTGEPMPSEVAVRVLRAKAAQLESALLAAGDDPMGTDYLAADVGLIAALLADHIERTDRMEFT